MKVSDVVKSDYDDDYATSESWQMRGKRLVDRRWKLNSQRSKQNREDW